MGHKIKLIFQLGWQRMSDASLLHWLYFLLPTSIVTIFTGWWANLSSSPVLSAMFASITFLIVFLALLASIGFICIEAKLPSYQSVFKCDQTALAALCHQLAHVKDDATGYARYDDSMSQRLVDLKRNGGIFLDSIYSSDFLQFQRGVECLINDKPFRTQRMPCFTLAERNILAEQVYESYKVLKEVLDNDYTQRHDKDGKD